MGRNDKITTNTSTAPAAPAQSLPLNDDSWDAFVFALSLDNQIGADLSNGRLQSLCDWISGGYRQRFTVIQKSELVAWAIENAKLVEQCKEVKAAIDAGTNEADLSDALLAKLVKVWLVLSKQEGTEAKLPRRDMESTLALADDPNKNNKQVKKDDKDKDRVKSSTLKKSVIPVKGPGVPGKTESRPPSPGPSGDTKGRKNKLRDRVGKADSRPVSIGDEPIDGPDVYYLLKDFDSPAFFNYLVEDHDVPLAAVVRFEDTGNPPAIPAGRKQTPNDPATIFGGNTQWHTLKSYATKAPEGSLWRDTAWLSVASTDVKDAKETFDIIAKKIYSLLQRRHIYQSYYERAKLIPVPEFYTNITVKNDLRYYDFLVSSATNHEHLRVDLLFSLAIEQLVKITPSMDEENEADDLAPNYEERGWLDAYFDRAVHQLSMTDRDVGDFTGSLSRLNNTFKSHSVKVVPWQNEGLFLSLFLDALHSLGMNPTDIMSRLQKVYRMRKFTKFLTEVPEYASKNPNILLREALLFRTEVARLNNGRIPEFTLDRLIFQLECEKLLKEKASAELKKWNLDSWVWVEHHDAATLAQVLQAASLYKPVVYHQISSRKGGLILALTGPGPIGALQYTQSHLISVTSKIGFASFNEILETQPETLGQNISIDKIQSRNSFGKHQYAYMAGDNLVRIHEEETFLYPAFETMIRITKRKSPTYGNENSSIFVWNNNIISFAGENGSKYGAYFTITFSDGSVFAVSKKQKNSAVTVTASTHGGQIVNFLPDRKIVQKHVEATKSMGAYGQENEVGRTLHASGKIVRFVETGGSQILYPDGSITTQTPDADIIKTKWDGHTTHEKATGGKTEYTIRVACEKDIATSAVVLAREDMVLIEVDQEKNVNVRHRDGTRILSEGKERIRVESPGFGPVIFAANTEDSVELEGEFTISRTTGEATSSVYRITKNDFEITIDTNGKATVRLPTTGFENITRGSVHILNLDWLKGTWTFKDINDAVFTFDEAGTVNVGKYEHSAGKTTPVKSFGTRLLKERVRISPCFPGSGNTPRLFFIAVDGSGQELLRDEDVLSHFQGHAQELDECSEEVTDEVGALGVTTISKLRNQGTKQPILLFRQVTRFPSVDTPLRKKMEVDLKVLEARKAVLNSLPGQDGAYETAFQQPLSGDQKKPKFIFGQNRAETEEAIVLKYMLKDDLAIRKATTPFMMVVPDDKKLVESGSGKKEMSWTKPKALKVSRTKKELSPDELKRLKITANAKLDKVTREYFKSPEGIEFLEEYNKLLATHKQEQPGTTKTVEDIALAADEAPNTVTRPVTVESHITTELRPKTAPEQALGQAVDSETDPRPTTGAKSEPGEFNFSLPPQSAVPSSIPVPVDHEKIATSPGKPRSDSKTVTIVETPTELTKPPEKTETRQKRPLPAALKAAKPGAEPNLSFEKERAFARKVKTASTALIHKQNTQTSYSLGGFVVLPIQCRFGKVMVGKSYSMKIFMTNIGIDSARYHIRQPKNKAVVVEYKPGPVAPGMKTVLTVHLLTSAESSSIAPGKALQEEFQVVSETEILHIPIHATVQSEQAFYDAVDPEDNPLVDLTSSIIPEVGSNVSNVNEPEVTSLDAAI